MATASAAAASSATVTSPAPPTGVAAAPAGRFELEKRRTEIAVNWAIAAVVYLIVGRIVSKVVSR